MNVYHYREPAITLKCVHGKQSVIYYNSWICGNIVILINVTKNFKVDRTYRYTT